MGRARRPCRPRKTLSACVGPSAGPGKPASIAESRSAGSGAWRVTSLLIGCYCKHDCLFLATHVLINQLNYMELRATAKTVRSRVSSGPAAEKTERTGFLRSGCASAGLWGGPGGLAGPGKPSRVRGKLPSQENPPAPSLHDLRRAEVRVEVCPRSLSFALHVS